MKKQHGFTLIEIMIALLLGLIVLSATIGIYITTVKGSSDLIKSARLNYDLDSVLALMVNDIRRAGYWGGSVVGSDAVFNPFTQATTNLQIILNGSSAVTDCVLYTYDANANGSIESTEFFGFKLNGTNIQMRLSGSATSNCNDISDDWQIINLSEGNEQVEVTTLSFTESFKCLRKRVGVVDLSYDASCAVVSQTVGNIVTGDHVIESRAILIALEGRVKIDQLVKKKVEDQVKIRNNHVYIQL